MALYVKCENVTCCDSFGVKYIPNEIKKLIGNKNKVLISSNICDNCGSKDGEISKEKIKWDIKNSSKMDEKNKRRI